MARSNNNNKLKAFVRFDGSGRVVSSSLIVQAFKPKVGNWKEIDAKECCNYTPTTTTTTTVFPNPEFACISVWDSINSIYVSQTYTFIGNDGNGYPVYAYIPVERPPSYLLYDDIVVAWYFAGTDQFSVNPTTTNILEISWPGSPVVIIITSGICA